METALQYQARLRAFADGELLHMLDRPAELSARDLALTCLEAEARGGITTLRARVEALPYFRLNAIGFWGDGLEKSLPRPQGLIGRGGHGGETPAIVAYLRSGSVQAMFLGHAHCRFPECGDGSHIGSTELTDGEWVWPEGLPHYIERHAVMLPEEFVAKMRDSGWTPPPFQYETAVRGQYRGVRYDLKRWLEWCGRHLKPDGIAGD